MPGIPSFLRPAAVMAACTAFLLSVSVTTQAEPRVLHYATPSAPVESLPTTQALLWWVDEVKKRSGGALEIQVHWLQSLVKYQDAAKGIGIGIADIGPMNPDYTAERMPLMTISQTELGTGDPYVTSEAMTRTVQKYQEDFDAELAKIGLVNLMSYSSGPRVFASNTRPYLTPADFKGDKVRLTPRSVDAARSAKWPVTAVNVAFADVYSALSQKTIDGAQLYLDLLSLYKQNEVVKYAVETDLGQSGIIVNMNLQKWNELSKEEQALMKELAEAYRMRLAQVLVEDIEESRKRMQEDPKYPVEFFTLTDEQRQLWITDYEGPVREHLQKLAKRAPKIIEINEYFEKMMAEVTAEVASKGYPWKQ